MLNGPISDADSRTGFNFFIMNIKSIIEAEDKWYKSRPVPTVNNAMKLFVKEKAAYLYNITAKGYYKEGFKIELCRVCNIDEKDGYIRTRMTLIAGEFLESGEFRRTIIKKTSRFY